ncbi:MAG: flagellar hook-associated family protein [Rhizobiaceae bacterium]|nr:MAG: flagellar hook-associated family protein [Rhizobiaceae bacterium]
MKTTFISSQAVSQALRYQMANMQQQLSEAQTEMVTGKVADTGLALGAQAGQAVSLSRDMDRLNGLVSSNALVGTRLTTTQSALGQFAGVAQSFMSTLVTDGTGSISDSVVQSAAQMALSSATSALNTNVDGEYIFSGINTDAQPINDFSPGSLQASFQSYFGFSINDPQAASLTGDQMNQFMDNLQTSEFQGTGWTTDWSKASDQPITNRISLNETAQTSLSANNEGVQNFMMAAAMITDLTGGNLSGAAKAAMVSKAISLVGNTQGTLTDQQSQIGLVQNRVSNANNRMNSQVNLFNTQLVGLEGVDQNEAATKISTLLNQIETSYTLTARLQKLSLVNYL